MIFCLTRHDQLEDIKGVRNYQLPLTVLRGQQEHFGNKLEMITYWNDIEEEGGRKEDTSRRREKEEKEYENK